MQALAISYTVCVCEYIWTHNVRDLRLAQVLVVCYKSNQSQKASYSLPSFLNVPLLVCRILNDGLLSIYDMLL